MKHLAIVTVCAGIIMMVWVCAKHESEPHQAPQAELHAMRAEVKVLAAMMAEYEKRLTALTEDVEMHSMGLYYTDRLQTMLHPGEVHQMVEKLPMNYDGACPDDGNSWYHRKGDRACVRIKTEVTNDR